MTSKFNLLLCILMLFITKTYAQDPIVREVNDWRITVTKMSDVVNSNFDDYSPNITADGGVMFFTSRRPFTAKEIKRNKEAREHVWQTKFNKDTKTWSTPTPLGNSINTAKRHSSNIGVSNDGQRLLLYQDDGRGNGDIYITYLSGSSWSAPISVGNNINTYEHESSASISPDGKTMYFVSNRKGGIGGRDIWKSELQENGEWGEATNLGSNINTKHDEETVYIHPDGRTLYFSSKGHGGLGGYDVFQSKLQEDGTWGKPINLGSPINTEGDDLFFVLSANARSGFYASDRGGKTKDIYSIDFEKIERPEEVEEDKGPELTMFSGTVRDKDTGEPIEAQIEVTDQNGNVIGKYNSNSETGNFLISLPHGENYGVNFYAKDYLASSFPLDLSSPETAGYDEINETIELDPIKVGATVVLKNIFFDFDSANLREESKAELLRVRRLLEENPNVKIEIGGHTDNKGSDAYNKNLSRERASSVVDYLKNLGIDSNRMSFKGYGMVQPIATNDTEEGRQENRRVEFKIME